MDPELRPRPHLEELFEGARAAGNREEPVGEVGHQRLAVVHGGHDAQIGEVCMRDFTRQEPVRDYPGHGAVRMDDGVGELAHESHARAAIDETYPAAGERRAEAACGCRVLRPYPGLEPQKTQTLRMGRGRLDGSGLRAKGVRPRPHARDECQIEGREALGLSVQALAVSPWPLAFDGNGGAGRNCTAVRKRLALESTCVSASVVSLPASRSGQNRRKPATVKIRRRPPWRRAAASLLKWHPFPTRRLVETDVAA